MMKKAVFILVLLGSASCVIAQQQSNSEVISLSEPVEETADYEVYGSTLVASNDVIRLTSIIEGRDSFKGKQVVTTGTIKQVCQKKGCFFMLSDGENKARITFKDYSFFIPTNSAGREVVVKGSFEVKELAEERAKHYAEDAGQNPDMVNGAQQEYSVVATSVKIMK